MLFSGQGELSLQREGGTSTVQVREKSREERCIDMHRAAIARLAAQTSRMATTVHVTNLEVVYLVTLPQPPEQDHEGEEHKLRRVVQARKSIK